MEIKTRGTIKIEHCFLGLYLFIQGAIIGQLEGRMLDSVLGKTLAIL